MTSTEQIVLRRAFPDDETQIALIAALDEEPRPDGDLLVAEVDGKIVAAVSVDGRRSIADPFEPTAEYIQLLRSRARQLRAEQRIGRVRSWLPARRSVKVAV
jgi:predicted ATP-grasp superfamily ATP-dependent carboligase